MKKLFTRLTTLATLGLSCSLSASAADLLVGPGRTYATITDAINAAADGDRILVKPKTALYTESPTITKSLTILSSDEGVLFKCGGSWTFAPSAAGNSLTIIGIHLTNGDIQATANAPAGARSQIRVLGSFLNNSRINFEYSNFDVTAAADSIIGEVNMRFGKVMGNFIDASNYSEAVDVQGDATATTDSIWVVGNRVRGTLNNPSPAFNFNTNKQYIFCANNFLSIGTYSYAYGIQMSSPLGTGMGKNSIVNNTIYNNGYNGYGNFSGRYGIQVTLPTDNVQVMNNLLLGTSPAYNGNAIVQLNGSNVWVLGYNYMRSGYSTNVTISSSANVGNVQNCTSTINTTTAVVTAGGDAINGGAPDDEYLDGDLSRNDAGCYGGSYSLANFPTFAANAANNSNLGGRVYFFAAPRVLLQGQPVKVRAAGFDR